MRRRMGILRVGGALLLMALIAVSTAAAEDWTDSGIRMDNAFGGGLSVLGANSGSGELFTDIMGTSISAQRTFRKALPSIYSYSQTAHYQNRADAGSTAGFASVDSTNYYVVCPTTMCSPGSKWVMWDVPFSVRETQKRDDGHLGYKTNVSGFATGISRMLGESSAIGLAVGYDYRKLTGRDNYYMSNKADTFHTALYGGTNIGHFFFDGYAGFSRSWNRTERGSYVTDDLVNFDRNRANFNDTVWSAGLKASYVWILPCDFRLTPSVGVDFSHVRFSGMTEKGWNDNLNIDSVSTLRGEKTSYSNVAVPIMVSLNKTFSTTRFLSFKDAPSLWTPEVRGGYVPQFGSERADVRMTDVGTGASWKATSAKFGQDYGTVGAGMKLKIADKYIFAVDYDYTFASKYQNHTLTAMYGVSF